MNLNFLKFRLEPEEPDVPLLPEEPDVPLLPEEPDVLMNLNFH